MIASSPLKPFPRLADRLAAILRQHIAADYQQGDKIDTIRVYCRRFDVSINTMGSALSILAREGLIEIRHGSGMYVRETAAPAAVSCIALLTELDILNPGLSRFFPYAFRELRKFFKAAGYRARLYTGERLPSAFTNENEACYGELLNDAARGEISGVVAFNGFLLQANKWKLKLDELGVPIVGDLPAFSHAVTFPHRQLLSAAVRELAAHGRRRIALVGWSLDAIEPFRQELLDHGLSYQPDWVRSDLHPNERGAGWAELREVWTSHREKPDGLIIADDQLVTDTCAAINDLGVRVPDQLMLVAHINKNCAPRATLPLTTLEYDTDAHVRAAGEMMLKLIRGEPVAESRIVGSDRFVLQSPVEMTESANK